MTKRSILAVAAVGAVACLASAPAWAQTGAPWIHVRVEEPAKESKVSVNLPISVLEAALAVAPHKIASKGRIHLGSKDHDLSVADLRRLWKELGAAGEAEIVSIEEKDAKVTVARAGDRVRIRVEKPSAKETVRVEVPVAVVDALLSGEGQELNLRAALAELHKLRGDLVSVDDEQHKVRIWIDERS